MDLIKFDLDKQAELFFKEMHLSVDISMRILINTEFIWDPTSVQLKKFCKSIRDSEWIL